MNSYLFLILVVLGIVGSLYFISYKNDSQAKVENEISSMPENISNSIADDTSIVVNEVESNTSTENDEVTTEMSNENPEVVEIKKETQTTTKNRQESTQTKSSSSNNNSNTQKKETVTQSTSQSTATTQTSTPSTQTTSQTSSSQSSKQEETKTEPKVDRCTNNNNHGMDVGNSGKWFNSKGDAVAYYNSQVSYWGNQWETDTIDDATYYKNCPTGYEVWSCMYCGKWTINFYYR